VVCAHSDGQARPIGREFGDVHLIPRTESVMGDRSIAQSWSVKPNRHVNYIVPINDRTWDDEEPHPAWIILIEITNVLSWNDHLLFHKSFTHHRIGTEFWSNSEELMAYTSSQGLDNRTKEKKKRSLSFHEAELSVISWSLIIQRDRGISSSMSQNAKTYGEIILWNGISTRQLPTWFPINTQVIEPNCGPHILGKTFPHLSSL
jgi:hypothetical protein